MNKNANIFLVDKIFLIFFILSIFFLKPSTLWAQTIDTQEQGEDCFKIARAELSKLGINVDRQILLKMRTKEEIQVHFISTGGLAIQVGGFYQPFNPESIWIIKGNSRNQTISDMAHELAHAWQSTNCPLQDRKITEGFAVWCQYKVLKALGDQVNANYLTQLKDPDYSGGLRLFLKIEKKKGIKGVLDYAKTATKPIE